MKYIDDIKDVIPFGIFVLDLEKNITYLNDECCRLLDVDKEDYIGLDFISLFKSEVQERLLENFKTVLESNETIQDEFFLPVKDDSRISNYLIIPLHDELGYVSNFMFYFITNDTMGFTDSEAYNHHNIIKLAAQAAKMGSFIVDKDYQYFWADDIAAHQIGFENISSNKIYKIRDFYDRFASCNDQETIEKVNKKRDEFYASESGSYDVSYNLKNRDGEIRTYKVFSEKLDSGKMSGVFIDITDILSADKEIRDLREKITAAMEYSNIGFWEIRNFGKENECIYVSSAIEKMFGIESLENSIYPIADWRTHLLENNSIERNVFDEIGKRLIEGKGWELTYEIRSKNKTHFVRDVCFSPKKDMDGKITSFSGLMTDISALEITRKKEIELLTLDHLTATKNRHAFSNDLANGFTDDMTILYIDLNDFKILNDTYGHITGDLVLVEYSKILMGIENSSVYRKGGDEFVVILKGEICTERLNDIIFSCMKVKINDDRNNITHLVTGSIGALPIKLVPKSHRNFSEILSLADYTMYQAKNHKDLSFRICDFNLIEHFIKTQYIESSVQNSINYSKIVPYFQPIYDIKQGKLIGLEALARWEDMGSIISAKDFIETFERLGKIHYLDLHVFEKTLESVSHLLDHNLVPDDITVTLNISPQSLQKIKVADLDYVLAKFPIKKEQCIIEIGETALVKHIIDKYIIELHNAGYKISVDDFVLGHSSLAALTELPISSVKINIDFFKNLLLYSKSQREKVLLSNISSLVNSLGSSVIIGNVENCNLLGLIKNTNQIENVQGYSLSRPLCLSDLIKLLGQLLLFKQFYQT